MSGYVSAVTVETAYVRTTADTDETAITTVGGNNAAKSINTFEWSDFRTFLDYSGKGSKRRRWEPARWDSTMSLSIYATNAPSGGSAIDLAEQALRMGTSGLSNQGFNWAESMFSIYLKYGQPGRKREVRTVVWIESARYGTDAEGRVTIDISLRNAGDNGPLVRAVAD